MADINSLIRVGKVSSINSKNLTARVYFPEMSNMVSGWLPVLQFPTGKTNSAGSHKHEEPQETDAAGSHTHTSWEWMPKVNDRVLVVMEYGFNSGGYIVGVVKSS